MSNQVGAFSSPPLDGSGAAVYKTPLNLMGSLQGIYVALGESGDPIDITITTTASPAYPPAQTLLSRSSLSAGGYFPIRIADGQEPDGTVIANLGLSFELHQPATIVIANGTPADVINVWFVLSR